MKIRRIFSVALICAMLVSLLCLPAFAASDNQFGGELRISEDYSSATFNGKMYVEVENDYSDDTSRGNVNKSDIVLSITQEENIKTIYAHTSDAYLFVDISFKQGGNLYISYLDSAYLEQYEDFRKNGGNKCYLSGFNFSLDTSFAKLKGEEKTIKGYELNYYPYSYNIAVITSSEDGYFTKTCGYVFPDADGNFWYVDIQQFGPKYADNFYPSEHESITIWQITDSALLSQLGDNSEYDDFNYDYDDTSTTVMGIISAIAIVLIFGVIPAVGVVLSIIFGIKTKAPYSTLFKVIAIILAAELILFLITAILLIIF